MAEPMKVESSNASVTQLAPPPTPAAPVPALAPSPPAAAARVIGAEQIIGRLLRTGALLSVSLFGVSVILEALPQTSHVGVAIDLLRKAGLAVLLVTPIARLAAAGAVLAVKGERKYAVYAAGSLLLLAFGIRAGVGH